jgi:hypothetical protein
MLCLGAQWDVFASCAAVYRSGPPDQPADFLLALAAGPLPPWPHRRIAWPDFWLPLDVGWARRHYHPKAVEMPWQARWVRTLAPVAGRDGR